MTQIEYLKLCIRDANKLMKTLGISIHWDEEYVPPKKKVTKLKKGKE